MQMDCRSTTYIIQRNQRIVSNYNKQCIKECIVESYFCSPSPLSPPWLLWAVPLLPHPDMLAALPCPWSSRELPRFATKCVDKFCTNNSSKLNYLSQIKLFDRTETSSIYKGEKKLQKTISRIISPISSLIIKAHNTLDTRAIETRF